MLIKEFRIVLPMTVEEYQVAQLWSVAEASKNETGGGEGVEVLANEPFEDDDNGKGQYTHKVYHLASRVPIYLKKLAPKGSLEFHEKAWNAYPYCKTVITNPDYMKEDFKLSIETWHKPDFGDSDNVHELPQDVWNNTEVIRIDIANDPISSGDYKEKQDPSKFTPKAEGRGPLTCDWIQRIKSQENGAGKMPRMCAYKLVKAHFKWFGFQNIVEKFIHRQERRLFTNFHRQVYCWMDNWLGLTMDDIRMIEAKTQEDLNEMRKKGSLRGTKVNE